MVELDGRIEQAGLKNLDLGQITGAKFNFRG